MGEQFEKMQGLICSLCEKSTCVSSRRKRSYGGGYYPGGYDPSTIWFQYLLCHEQKISCYFFTQGWNEKEFGQYYLYENLFDTGFDKLGHASSGTDDLLFLALLGGLGGSHQYPHQAYPSYKKRRHVEDEEDEDEEDHAVKSVGRRRRGTADPDDTSSGKPDETSNGRRRRSDDETSNGRRRRSDDETSNGRRCRSDDETSNGRRRRSDDETSNGRRRRSDDETSNGRRRRSDDET